MSYQIAFISLGCAKNQVNCEQMMSLVQAAGYQLAPEADGADAAVVNTTMVKKHPSNLCTK